MPDRTALVSGAGRGLGAAIADRLAHDGAAVALLDLDEAAAEQAAERIRSAGGRALAVAVDVSDEHAVESAVARVAAELGAPTILVNNAGVTRDNSLRKMTVAEWDLVMNVHLRGSFLLARTAQAHMVNARFGRIVNISSTGALGNRGQANYSAAKAGLQGFTKTLALELGRYGVTVNCVAPGFIETDMTHQAASTMGMTFEQLREAGEKQIAVGRIGQPEDIADAVAFFASETAGFVSGQVLYVSGGPA
jgi:3-oxoacyl-[acyl-carrier protein] reductase